MMSFLAGDVIGDISRRGRRYRDVRAHGAPSICPRRSDIADNIAHIVLGDDNGDLHDGLHEHGAASSSHP